jgi:ABC-type antimicrobial peptide transport system permease subunit
MTDYFTCYLIGLVGGIFGALLGLWLARPAVSSLLTKLDKMAEPHD